MNADKDRLDSLTERVLGAGFLERVYQQARRAMYRLFASLRPDCLSSRQFPEA
jgi:hypothetical protein